MPTELKRYCLLVFFVVGILLRPNYVAAQGSNNTVPNLPSTSIVDVQLDSCPRFSYLPLIHDSLREEEKIFSSLSTTPWQMTMQAIPVAAHQATQALPILSPELTRKLQAVPVVTAVTVFTEATSLWLDASPDPSGIDRFGDHRVIISDSEANEQPGRTKNIWVFDLVTRQVLSATSTVTNKVSSEPTDIALTRDGTIIISDDVSRKIIAARFEPDGNLNRLYAFDTRVYGSTDPEGADVFIANQHEYLVTSDARDNTVYIHHPGPNQLFDGPCPPGDDTIRKFNSAELSLFNPAGVFAIPNASGDSVDYYLVGESDRQHIYVVNATADHAELAYKIDIGALSMYHKMAGIVVMPNTQIVLLFRGVDNDSDPDENDGVLAVIQPSIVAKR